MHVRAGQLELDFIPEPTGTRLRLVRAPSNRALWDTCARRFLSGIEGHVGPAGYPAAIWLAHRTQRDALYEHAASLGLSGWLAPPVYFLSELPRLFDIPGRSIGLFTRRRLINRLASEAGAGHGIGMADTGSFRGHVLDGLFSELLPEGVTPDELEDALELVAPDSFSRRRNAWIVQVYRAYADGIGERGLYDPRSIHAMVAERIRDGGLAGALPGVESLHVYGVTSLRTRHRLFDALAAQPDADVSVYLPSTTEATEWDELNAIAEVVGAPAGDGSLEDGEPGAGHVTVQPAPDAQREFQWIAKQIKELLAAGDVEPHDIAVVARSGRDDTRRAFRALHSAGIPCTARMRTPLSEVAALKALLELFRSAAARWSYRPFRNVLASRYFKTGLAPRWLDDIARRSKVDGLDAWERELRRLLDEARSDGRSRRRSEWLARQLDAFREFKEAVRDLMNARTEREWVELTSHMASGRFLSYRSRICRPIEQRWDVVRLDQRAAQRLEGMLLEWAEEADDDRRLSVGEWFGALRRLLETSELALSTPMQKGVQILEAHEAALTPFRSTFIVHANDGEFPKASTAGGVLSDAERVTLREAGLPVSHRDEAMRRERTLWASVAAAPRLVLTYRTTDPNGTPLLPSLLVPAHDESAELPRSHVPVGGPISDVEARRHSASRLRERMREVDASTDGSTDAPIVVVPAVDPDRLRHAIVAATAERMRNEHPELGMAAPPIPNPWNGHIRDPVILRNLEWRYGPDYQWSPATLERYAKCPFFFFVRKVLKISEDEEAGDETDVATWGSIAHEILERFYRRTGDALPARLDEAAEALYEEIAGEVLDDWEGRESWLGLPPLWTQARESLRESVRDFLAWDLKLLHRDDQVPWKLEYAFGYGSDRTVTIEGEDLDGVVRSMRLTGRIDRVDRIPGGARHHIIDYKSGGATPAKGYEDGSALQAPIYMKAVAAAEGVDVTSGGYRSIRRRSAMCVLQWGDARFERSLRIAFSIPERVHQGLFEAVHSAATDWEPWEVGRDVRRTDARYRTGSRFDG